MTTGDLSRATVLVTPRSYREADEDARAELEASVGEVRYNDRGRTLRTEELAAELGDVDGVIAGLDRFDAEVLAAAPQLRVIARYGTGVDAIDLDAAAGAGVVVTNTPAANSRAVAELALGLTLALLRHIPALDRDVRSGSWTPRTGLELAEATIGVLGLGRVGARFADLATAVGAQVVAHDPFADGEVARDHGVELVDMDQLAARSRVLSLHAPVTATTRDVVDRALLGALPEGALLVNTARGELVVEQDLADALDSGHLGGAALDAFREEPPPPDHPLLGRENVILTPHVGAQTAQARAAMARTATTELLTVLAGREPRFAVTGGPA